MSNNQEQPAVTPEPPFWYVVLLADEFHFSLKEARECAMREMEQERQAAIETEEIKP